MSRAGISLDDLTPVTAGARRTGSPSSSAIIAVCFLVVAGVVVMTILGSAIAPYDPNQQDVLNSLSPPTGAHWFGTDALGRDILSRVIAGARTAFLGPLVIAAGSMIIGNVLGLLAGYRGGRTDAVIMRWVDLMFAFPSLLIAIVVVGTVGGGYWTAVALLIVLTSPLDTRIIRGATLEQTPRPYVEAAKTLGVSDARIVLLHIWPNVAAVTVANSFLIFAGSLVALSGLAFLGLGVHPGTPDWGLMLAESRDLLFANPVAALAPGTMIVLTATAMNLIGDWLYERISSRGATR
jgi:peptide/nickel transport system permease protein